jgi:hypothetical protein
VRAWAPLTWKISRPDGVSPRFSNTRYGSRLIWAVAGAGGRYKGQAGCKGRARVSLSLSGGPAALSSVARAGACNASSVQLTARRFAHIASPAQIR